MNRRLLLLITALTLFGCSPNPFEGVSNPAQPPSGQPRITIGPNGHIVLSWLETSAGIHTLNFARLVNDQWSEARAVHTSSDILANWADVPSVLATSDNRLVAHWPSRTPDMFHGYHVAATRSADAGQSWESPRRPYTDDSPAEHGFASLFEADLAGIVWLDGRQLAKPGALRGERSPATQLRSRTDPRQEQVVADRVCDCCQTDITHTKHGPLLAFRGRTNEEFRDIYVARWHSGAWQPGQPVAADNWQVSACPINGPAISSFGERATVAWFTAADDRPRIQVAFADAPTFQFQPAIDIQATRPIGRVAVTMISDVLAAVVWVDAVSNQRAELMLTVVHDSGRVDKRQRVAVLDRIGPDPFPRVASTADFIHIAWVASDPPSALQTVRLAISSAAHD